MKFLRAIVLFSLCIGVSPAFAEADDHSLLSAGTENYIGYGAIIAMLILFIVVMLVLLRTFRVLTRLVLKSVNT